MRQFKALDWQTIFLFQDQPMLCPYCQSRTDIVVDMYHTRRGYQIHECLRASCRFLFLCEQDSDYDEEDDFIEDDSIM